MLLNIEEHRIEGYTLHIVDKYRLKEIMYDFTLATKPEHKIELGYKKTMVDFYDLNGNEDFIRRNLRTQNTGKTEWTGGFYNETSYTVYINEYDEYKCPEIYGILGVLLNSDNNSDGIVLKSLSRLSRLCELKRIPLKKVFDAYREELLSLILLQKINNNYLRKLNKLYEVLYIENQEIDLFSKKEFMQKYRVYQYNLKNIKKV